MNKLHCCQEPDRLLDNPTGVSVKRLQRPDTVYTQPAGCQQGNHRTIKNIQSGSNVLVTDYGVHKI